MQSHYNFTFDQLTNTYIFITKNGILYRIAFILDETFSTISGEKVPDVYQMVVEKVFDDLEPLDYNVSKTIIIIIELFFQNQRNSLLYICSDADNKAFKRFQTFQRWYKNHGENNDLIKIDNSIEIVDRSNLYRIFTSLIMHRQNPNFNKILGIYKKIEEVLNQEK